MKRTKPAPKLTGKARKEKAERLLGRLIKSYGFKHGMSTCREGVLWGERAYEPARTAVLRMMMGEE